jgi:multiple sugar transport system substrate-binding protein
MAEALTVLNDDGSIKTLGFNPLMGFYENSASHYGALAGAGWLSEDGRAAIADDPAWTELIEWQKAYVKKIGYDKLQAFTAGLGQEFSADNAFQTGPVAMNMDGEYRTAFIDDQTPDLDYGTAPMPVADGHDELYGGGYITGNIAGIGKGSKNPELAWALLKYLSTDTSVQVELGNGLKNVPTLTSALTSPKLEVDSAYKTFIDAANDPDTITSPATSDGASYLQTFQNWWADYQQNGGDLTAKLKTLDKNIDDANKLAGP